MPTGGCPIDAMKLWRITILCLVLLALLTGAEAKTEPRVYRAVAYSALLPGGGQIYNQQYIKAGVVIGIQGFLIGSAIYHDGKRDDYKALAESSIDPLEAQQYLYLSKDYRNKLRSDYWWMGITAALSMIDAYVDAHLWDYDAQRERIRLKFEDSKLQLQIPF